MPWIAVDSNVRGLLWRFPSGAAGEISDLHPLDESDCLVGEAAADDSGIGALFPNRRIVTIHLDAEDLRSSAMAWETLDAMLLTPEEWQKLPSAAPPVVCRRNHVGGQRCRQAGRAIAVAAVGAVVDRILGVETAADD